MRQALRTFIAWVLAAVVQASVAATSFTGRVVEADTGKGVAEAIVRLQGTHYSTRSDESGRFRLEAGGFDPGARQLTAWKSGYSIGAAPPTGGETVLKLERLPLDDPAYAYQAAEVCGSCHTDIYAQFKNSSMARAMSEKLPQKLQFYLGERDGGRFDGLGFGWKYFAPMLGISQGMHAMDLDHAVGTCTNCHARGVTWKKGVLEPHRSFDPDTRRVSIDGAIKVFRMDRVAELPVADGREGISCDVCHSVEDVRIHTDRRGNLSTVDITKMEVVRRGDVKFGPLDDAVSPFHKSAYSPVFRRSEFCAMCHMERADDLEVVGVPSLLTLDEYPVWKANFDAGKTDKQCQDCHMYTGGRGAWSADKVALMGVDRDPATLNGHHWRGSYFDGEMARRASNLRLAARRVGDEVIVTAEVANVGAAHKMPAGPPFRQMLLLIDAADAQGKPLAPLDPPRAKAEEAAHANRIFDVGEGYRKYGFFKLWELQNGQRFPAMPYEGRIGKIYNAAWVTPPFMPMQWMLQWGWIGLFPLATGLLGWSPWNAVWGRRGPNPRSPFRLNVGTLDRLQRIAGGALILWLAPWPWNLIGIVPLFSGLVAWCPTYWIIGRLDTRERKGWFVRNVGAVDRLLRIVAGALMLALLPSPWHLLGLIPLISGVLGWCPTYRFIKVDTLDGGLARWLAPNLGTADRIVRALGGVFLLSLVFWGPQTPWGLIGIVPLFTAAIGSCIPYRLAGLDTRSEAEKSTGATFAWVNLDPGQRRVRLLVGGALVLLATALPAALAMHMWPVGGFAAERVLYDTRIDFRQSDVTHYRFRAPAGAASVSAELVYLRHWYFMEAIKGAEFWSTDKFRYRLHRLALTLPDDKDARAQADAGNHDGSLADMPPVPSTPGAGALREVTAAVEVQR
ncbi:MAG: YgaP-like transmembrane domain [Burkholderiaceae bacterium]